MTLGDAVAGEPAVWFAGVNGEAGVVWSVNDHAVDVSEVGKAHAGGSISDDDVEAALSCLPCRQ
jgi:hypothetical protein